MREHPHTTSSFPHQMRERRHPRKSFPHEMRERRHPTKSFPRERRERRHPSKSLPSARHSARPRSNTASSRMSCDRLCAGSSGSGAEAEGGHPEDEVQRHAEEGVEEAPPRAALLRLRPRHATSRPARWAISEMIPCAPSCAVSARCWSIHSPSAGRAKPGSAPSSTSGGNDNGPLGGGWPHLEGRRLAGLDASFVYRGPRSL